MKGVWPGVPEYECRQYNIDLVKRLLRVFHLTKYSGFKRSCVVNAPKVGSGGSLPPRGDYRAPSDSEATVWLAQLDRIPDEESE